MLLPAGMQFFYEQVTKLNVFSFRASRNGLSSFYRSPVMWYAVGN